MKKVIYTLILLIPFLGVQAQTDLGLHFLPQVWQSQQTNPALLSPFRVNIALPAPAVQVGHSGFKANSLLQPLPGTDSLVVNLDDAIASMAAQNYLRTNVRMDLLAVGLRFNNLQLSLSAAARAQVYAAYPRSLVELAWNGNAAFLGETLEVGPDLAAFAYSEIALGGAYRFNKLTIGAKFKYLNGLMNVETESGSLTFETDPEYYQLRGTLDYQLRTSVVDFGDLENFEPQYEPDPVTGNIGYGIDLGATYDFSKRLRVSASVMDLGSIKWTDAAKRYRASGNLNFDGIDVAAIALGDSAHIETLLDSLQNQIQLSDEAFEYRTSLPTQMMASIRFSPLAKLHLNGMVYNERYRGQNFPAMALGVSKDFGKVFTLGASYNIRHRSYNQLGMQMWLRLGPFAGFLILDNVLAPVFPMQSKYVSLRAGMNLSIGRIEKEGSPMTE
ncbi:MAG: DUF5723 family protein [Bacteroidota bacterium]